MVVIRLARSGAKKRPFYHMVVTDKRNPRDGRYIERVGYFNPVARGQDIRLRINQERINYWQSVGAKASNRVDDLLAEFDRCAIDMDDFKAVPALSDEIVKKRESKVEKKLAIRTAKEKAQAAEEAKAAKEAAAADEAAAAENAQADKE